MTIFSVTKDGVVHACDSRCYDAKKPNCSCPCGGKNHGVGLAQALKNTNELLDEFLEEFADGKPIEVYKSEQAKKGKL